MITRTYLVKCPNCEIDYPLSIEVEEDIELKEGESVMLDRQFICSCEARIDEWGLATKKNGKIELSAGIKGFSIPSKYNFINEKYE